MNTKSNNDIEVKKKVKPVVQFEEPEKKIPEVKAVEKLVKPVKNKIALNVPSPKDH